MLYVFESENANDSAVELQDKVTGVALKFQLGSQRAAVAVISKTSKQVVARYGF